MNAHETTDHRAGRGSMRSFGRLAGWPARRLGGAPGDGSRTAYAFGLIFVLLAAGIVTTGGLYFRNYERRFRAAVERQLSAVAELKVGELARYRMERLGDADILFQNPALSLLVRRFLEQPDEAESQRQLRIWLGKCQSHYQYDRAFLLDAQGVTRMAAPAAPEPVGAFISRRASEVLRTGQVAFQDFYRSEPNQPVYLALLVPMLDESEARRPLGVVVLRIDPATFLYPFLRRWPTPSRTAETLLLRREGNEAVFLNELKFQTNTALNLRTSLENTSMPAVKAALGQEGIVEGPDYRGVPVLAAVRAVADSPWFLVARMDITEVDAPLRERLWQVAVLMGALLFGAGASVGLVWRRQRAQFYKERVRAAAALRTSQELYRSLVENLPQSIFRKDRAGRFLFANERFCQGLGRSWEDIVGKTDADFFTPAMAQAYRKDDLRVMETGQGLDQAEKHVGADGRELFVQVVKTPLRDAQAQIIGVQGIFWDITARQQMEEALRRSEEHFRALIEHSSDVILVVDKQGTITYVSPSSEHVGGYKPEEMIGESAFRFIVPADLPRAMLDYGKAVLTKNLLIPNAFRVRHKDGSERIWEGLGKNLLDYPAVAGFIMNVRDVTERQRAEQALEESEERLRTVIEASLDAIIAVDTEGRIVLFNGAAQDLFQYSREEALHQPAKILLREETGESHQKKMERFLSERVGQCGHIGRRMEKTFRRKDGSLFEAEAAMSAGRHDGLRMVVLAVRDITELKRAEAALRTSQELYRSLVENLPQSIFRKDRAGRFLFANERFCQGLGRSWEDIVGKTDADFFTPAMAQAYRKDDLRVMETGQGLDQAEKHVGADGRELFVQVVKTPLRDAQAQIIGVQGIFWDITARQQMEDALQFTRLSLDNAADVMICVGRDARFIDVNNACCRAWGYSRAELLSLRVHDIDPDYPAEVWPEFWEKLKQSGSLTFESRHRTKEGRVYPVEIAATFFEYNGKEYHCAFTRDITERKRAEEELLASREQLRALSRHLQSLREEERAGIAREIHDELGQMLTGLKMDLHWAEDQLEALRDARLNPVTEKLAAATGLTDDIFTTVHRIASELRPGVLDQLGLMMALHHEAGRFEQRTGIACRLDLPPDTPTLTPETVTAFFRIFQEALTNVARHAAASAVQASFRCEAGGAVLEIRDNGKGISEDALSGVRSLGLLGMTERAQLLGGTVAFQRGAGGGTRVLVRLPAPTNPA
jgi:PAS domain S-box-containing protein